MLLYHVCYKNAIFICQVNNACVRKDSRTKRLADRLIEKLNGTVEEVSLDTISFPTVDRNFLIHRDELIAAGDFVDPLFDLAHQFAAADVIVVADPYYDLSFPASLKQYLEQINVVGIEASPAQQPHSRNHSDISMHCGH